MKIKASCCFGLLVLSAIFTFSCKKDKEENSFPVISFYSPDNNKVYQVYDSIYVSAYVSDASQLKTVSVGLSDVNNVPVQEDEVYQPGGKTQEIALRYRIYNYRIPSAYYYVVIRASNGLNSAYQKRLVYIHTSPQVKLGYYFFSDNAAQTSLVKTDTAFNSTFSTTLNGRHPGAAVSGYNEVIYVAGGVAQFFHTYDTKNNALKWTIPNLGAGQPYFSYCGTDGKNALIGFCGGELKRVDKGNSTLMHYNNPYPSFYPDYAAAPNSSQLVVHYTSPSLGTQSLFVFGLQSGLVQSSVPVPFKTLGVFNKSPQEAYVVSNAGNQAQLDIITLSSASLYNPLSLPAGKALSCCSVDSTTVLIGHSDGNIYRYTYNNGLMSIKSGITADKMYYNSSENLLYVSSAKTLNVYALTNALPLVKTYTHADTIRNFQVLYDK